MRTDGVALFYDFLEDPPAAVEEAHRHPPVGYGLLAYLLSALSLALAQGVAGKAAVSGASLALAAAWSLGAGVLMAAVIHLFAEMVGGRGRVVPLFVLLGYSELGWALALPGALVWAAFAPGSAWAGKAVFALAGALVLFLKARSVRLNYGFSWGQAWFSLLGPYAAVAASALLALAAGAWWLVSQVSALSG